MAEAVIKPTLYWDTNVVGIHAPLTEMRLAQVRRLVFSSTASTYRKPQRVPIREEDPAIPINRYGAR